MKAEDLLNITGADFFTGVPDSLLRALIDCLMDKYGIDPEHHIICADEGNCAALAAGYHLASGKIPAVYLQNSGLGNIVNPAASLLHSSVYAIPQVFIIGWRGEPETPDEPQHIFQGKITLKLLEDLDICTCVISPDTKADEVKAAMEEFKIQLKKGRSAAFLIKKGALSFDKKVLYKNNNKMTREEVIEHIVKISKDDPVIASAGKAGRELYEIRNRNKEGHQYDFLTAGAMGHCSSIALGAALHKPDKTIWCIDGDCALLMHMGALAVIGAVKPKNLIHIVIDNAAHDSVGGMPSPARSLDIPAAAKACGYPYAVSVNSFEELDKELNFCRTSGMLCLISVKCAIGARNDLGRPKEQPAENKKLFMKHLEGKI